MKGEETHLVDLVALCKAVGVNHVHVVDAFDTSLLENTLKEAVNLEEIVVIIAKAPCALLKKGPITKQYRVNDETCRRCGMCLKPGCPAITKKEDGAIVIDDTMCDGCGLCEQMCRFGAIEEVIIR